MKYVLSVIAAFSFIFQIQSVASAEECSNEVKKSLAAASWKISTEFSGGWESWTVNTRVTEDGRLLTSYRGEDIVIDCDGIEISFPWKNSERKRYTFEMKKSTYFEGSRSGDYEASLEKK